MTSSSSRSEEEQPQERIWLKFREVVENPRTRKLHYKEWTEITSKASFTTHSYRNKEGGGGKLYHYSQHAGYEDREIADWGIAPPKRRTKRYSGSSSSDTV
jgi:hypothetical protein